MTENNTSQDAKAEAQQRIFALVFFALIAYAFSELWSFYAENRERVNESIALYEQLYGADAAMLRTSTIRASNPTAGPLASVATITAGKFEIDFARFEPLSEDSVKVWFENTPYESLAQWINDLEYVEGVSAVAMNIERGNADGTVSGQVELVRLN